MIATLLSLLFATDTGGFWMPRKASTVAGNIDLVFDWVLWASVFFFIGIVICLVYFSVKYRKTPTNLKTHPISGSTKLEVWWTIIPTIGLFVLFGFGFYYWIGLAIPPGDSMEIRVNAKRWAWTFDYPRHKISNVPELIVPQDRNIKLVMMSTDVLHSFFVPEFRIKRDVLPNRYTVVWFNVPKASLTRLESVQKNPKTRHQLGLPWVVEKMAFARDTRAAKKLITAGHILINDKIERNVGYQVKLNDRIEVAISKPKLAELRALRREYAKKVKAATSKGDDAQASALRKEGEDAFIKAAPKWLLQVIASMRAARQAKDAIKAAEGAIKMGVDVHKNPKLKPSQKLQARDAAAKATKDLPVLRSTYAKRYHLPEWLYADRDSLDGMWGFVSDTFNVFCTEYCGKEHSRMITRVRVVNDDLYHFWLKRSLSKSPTGKQLMERYGCTSCHSIDGSSNTGPTFLGLYGRQETVTDKQDNKIKTLNLVDTDKKKLFSEYIRESIYKPQAKIVKGYENQLMPTFQGQMPNEHVEILIDYLKFLKPAQAKK